MNHNYTLTNALTYAKEGLLEKWIHAFLETEGNNIPFSRGLRIEQRKYQGPLKVDLSKLIRTCGPEEGMKYYEPKENFESRVHNLMDLLKQGWDMPPLIANEVDGVYILNDGSHRIEALKRLGYQEYYVILWHTVE